MNNPDKIGIIGLGFLGGSMDKYFVSKGITPFRYDKKGIGSVVEINHAEIIFICVNTPYDKEKRNIDLSFVSSAISIIKGEKIIVIRSTVPPGTTENLQRQYPNHKFLFNPEFLRAKTAYEDFLNPPRQIVGYTEKSKELAQRILDLLPKAPEEYTRLLSAKDAEIVKYAANVMLAIKVAAANKIFDFCEKLSIDYEEIRELIGADSRIGQWGLEIFYEGFRGYNGTCFPKDVRTFISLGEANGINVDWLKALDDENIKNLKNQNLEPDYGFPNQIK